jgi:Flp pilus assembly protein TadG
MTRRVQRRLFERLRDARGANLVEAAILAPFLLLLTFGIAEFAMLFYVYLALENGASQASRYGVTGQVLQNQTREASVKAAMRRATPTLTLDDGAFSFSFMPLNGPPNWQNGIGGPNDISRVTINYTWTFITPIIRPFFGPDGAIQLTVESAMKNESFQ